MEKRDIKAKMELFSTDKGGRKGPTSEIEFHCPLKVDSLFFDVRIWLKEIGSIEPGTGALVYVGFLDWTNARTYFPVGRKFELWEGGVIGLGEVTEVLELQRSP